MTLRCHKKLSAGLFAERDPSDFDVIRQDRFGIEFHGGVLGELLGVVGGCAALDDEAAALTQHAQVANAIAEAAHDQVGELGIFRAERRVEHAGRHKAPSCLGPGVSSLNTLSAAPFRCQL